MRFGEHLGEEPLEEPLIVPEPVVLVVLGPALVGVQFLVPGVQRPVLDRFTEGDRGQMNTADSTRSAASAANNMALSPQ